MRTIPTVCSPYPAIMFVGIGILFGSAVNEKAAPGLCSVIISVAGMLGGIWMQYLLRFSKSIRMNGNHRCMSSLTHGEDERYRTTSTDISDIRANK